jgi:hypothetical protein
MSAARPGPVASVSPGQPKDQLSRLFGCLSLSMKRICLLLGIPTRFVVASERCTTVDVSGETPHTAANYVCDLSIHI